MSSHAVEILDAETDHWVKADLEDDLTAEVLLDIEDQWTSARQDLRNKLEAGRISQGAWPQSLHWNWGQKSLSLVLGDDRDAYRVMGVRGQLAWEAVMVTIRRGHHAQLMPDAGKPLVYVDFLEVAPWNWTVEAVGQKRRYRAIGPLLLRAAVEQSRAEGWDGRLALHALPQAEEFYRGQGLSFVQYDNQKRLPYYELTAAEAQAFIRG